MRFIFCALGLFITAILISCNNRQEASVTDSAAIKNIDTLLDIQKVNADIDSNQIIENLQGEWKEPEYPFRRAHFKNTSVKFVEEGLAGEPTFKEFRILNECPFAVNNIKNATPDDVFLVIEENRTCEIVKILNDTLILSGFNINTSSDYNIYYKKVK